MEKIAALLAGAALIVSLAFMTGGTGPAFAIDPVPTATKTPTPTPTKTPTPTPTPTPRADRGCTPGFWKTHPSAWPAGISPSQSVVSLFSGASAFPTLASATLLQALEFGGGSGALGGASTLLRTAVAAELNALAFGSAYPYSASGVISMTNAALASGNRSTMLSLAANFDAANNLGCPIN